MTRAGAALVGSLLAWQAACLEGPTSAPPRPPLLPPPEVKLEISPPASTSRETGEAAPFATRSIGRATVAHDGARPGAASSRGAGPGARRIDLDVRDADVHDVLRLLADVGGVSVVVPGEIAGRVTLHLRDVRWDQALDVVAALRGLQIERAGDVVHVTRAPP